MKVDQVRAFFHNRADSYRRLARWSTDSNLLASTASMLTTVPVQIAVEIGCGEGIVLRLANASHCIGIDISERMLKSCDPKGIDRLVGDVHELPIRNRSVDLVICRQVLHYCVLERVFGEIARILTRGKYFHIVQKTDFPEAPAEWVREWTLLRGIPERQHLSRDQIVSVATEAGFSVECEHTVDIAVQHTWADFFEKNCVRKSRHQTVIEFIQGAPREATSAYRLYFDEKGLRYRRRFTLLLLRGGHFEESVLPL
jgi:ubiquinone/menaquinone biosynthesis C-methylase UbiE